MDIRPGTVSDLEAIFEIDSVIESTHYLHMDRTGQGLNVGWKIEQRPLREKLIAANPLPDDAAFTLRQVLSGADEGVALVAEHDGQAMALLLAQERPQFQTMELLDLRVDCELRRQGIATVMLFQLIQIAKDKDLRAVTCTTLTNNAAAAILLEKLGWNLSGLDTHRMTNHDFIEERATLIWHYEIV